METIDDGNDRRWKRSTMEMIDDGNDRRWIHKNGMRDFRNLGEASFFA